MDINKNPACRLKRDYEKLEKKRAPFLQRSRDYSRITLPYVLPQEGTPVGEANKRGYQGIGAEAVNHLSNKVVQALFPVNEPFFQMELDPELELEFANKKMSTSELAVYFKGITDLCLRTMSKLKMRPLLVQNEKHLIISGNGCLVFTDTGVRQLGLDKYVVRRDPEGKVLVVITKEQIVFDELPKEVRAVYLARNPAKQEDKLKGKELPLYTGYYLKDDEYEGMQSVDDILIFSNKVPAAKLPIITNRWNATSGEDYGRGLVEDHSGDFHVLNFLSEARARGAATMMDVKYLVKPGSLTDIDTLNEAPTGEFVQGMDGDITVLQLDKYADSRLIDSVMMEYRERIGRSFLMLQTTVRDSERTTKYEVQRTANELDLSMGGVYSSQAEELQHPIAIQLLDMVNPKLINQDITAVISTGLEALGRAAELEKIYQYSNMLSLTQTWPEALQQKVDWVSYSEVVAANLSLDTSGFFLEQPEGGGQQPQGQSAQPQDATSTMEQSMAASLGSELGKKIGSS